MNFGAAKENHLIMQRRADEARRTFYNNIAQADAKGRFLAKWENTTSAGIEQNHVKKELEKLKRQAHKELESRRDRLADKLAQEDAALRRELRENQETPANRREKIMAKAKALKERREKRDREMADKQLYKKFVRDCDELREAKSRAKVLDYQHQRNLQMKEKEEKDKYEQKVDEFYTNEWNKIAEEGMEREQREKRAAIEKRAKLNKYLDEQMENRDIRELNAKKRQEQEDQRMREIWDMERQKAEAEQAARVEQAREIQAETNEYNRRKENIREEDARREKELDDRLLAQVLDEEAKQKAAEEAHKKKLKDQAKRYQELLREQMKKEAEDESELEGKRNEEVERQYQKRKAQWDREAAARDRLMNEVIHSREQQIAERQRKRAEERRALDADRARLQEQLKKRTELEMQDAMEKKKLDKEHQDFLRKQMDAKRQTRDAMFQMQRAQQKAEIEARQAYERALKREMEELEKKKPQGYGHIPVARKTSKFF